MEYFTSQQDASGDGGDGNCDFFDESDDDGEDLLNLSAHSSGSGGSSVHPCLEEASELDGNGTTATAVPSSSSSTPAAPHAARAPQNNDDVALITEEPDLQDDNPLENEAERLSRLVGEAQYLLSRFNQFCIAHPQLPGLTKLRTRFEREVELGEAALGSQQLKESLTTGEPESAAKASRPAYVKCNCVPLLELTMHVLENEPNIVAVMHPVNPATLMRNMKSGVARHNGAPGSSVPTARPLIGIQLPTTAFEVDVISCSGTRWVKIKGTSRRNLELELSASADRRPFSSVLENLVKGAAHCRLQFGATPQIDVLFYYRPSQEMVDECINAVHRATNSSSVVNNNSTSLAVQKGQPTPPVLTVHVFENAIKKYLSTKRKAFSRQDNNDRESSTATSPPPTAAAWHDLPLRARFDAMPSIWSPLFLAPIYVQISCVNFDVTALVALCSDTCNGYAGSTIPNHQILDEQSRDEVKDPAVTGHIEGCLAKYSRPIGTAKEMERLIATHILEAGGDPSKLVVAPVRGCPLNAQQRSKLLFLEDAAEAADGFVCTSTDAGRLLDASDLQFASNTLQQLHLAAKSAGPQEEALRRNWIVSDVALAEFLWIIGTIAGPTEYRRAVLLLRHMYVVASGAIASALTAAEGGTVAFPVEGCSVSLDAVMRLDSTGKISERHKAVFGLGNAAHAVTLSANKQFAQAARDQGVEVCVEHHPSRALTERKRQGEDRMDGPRKPPLPAAVQGAAHAA